MDFPYIGINYRPYVSHYFRHEMLFKGCDTNFEVNIFQIFKVATNETSTLHLTVCT